jgi:hypothetical protein
LRELLLPTAREVNRAAAGTIPHADIERLKRILTKIRANLAATGVTRAAPAKEGKGLIQPDTDSK